MTARNILSTTSSFPTLPAHEAGDSIAHPSVSADTHIIEVLHCLLDSPTHLLSVYDNGSFIGTIDYQSMLKGLSDMIVYRDECSVLNVSCRLNDYSASAIARAVEDVDAHLLDLITTPSEDEYINVALRVSHSDPSAVEKSLLRYGFEVTDSFSKHSVNGDIAAERLAQLAVFLNV